MEEHEGEESEVENVDVSDEDAEEDQCEEAIDTEVLRIGKRTCSAFIYIVRTVTSSCTFASSRCLS